MTYGRTDREALVLIRDVGITRSIIDGTSYKDAALENNLSSARISQIFKNTIRKAFLTYKLSTGTNTDLWSITVHELRKDSEFIHNVLHDFCYNMDIDG